MIRLGVAGALGRMGKAIIRLASQNREFDLKAAMEREDHAALSQPLGDHLEGANLERPLAVTSPEKTAFKTLDVVIDFTTPAATLKHVGLARMTKTAMVIGTTGFSPSQRKKIEAASKQIPILIAPNMSVGANLIFALASQAASLLSDDYDIEITEAHHRHKKDAPSGTAKRLAEIIARAKGWNLDKVAVYGRRGVTGKRPKRQIGIHVIRAGEIIGEHTAIFSGPGETIEIRHHAGSRDAFAEGALVAAQFIAKKRKGLFGMEDVLEQIKNKQSKD